MKLLWIVFLTLLAEAQITNVDIKTITYERKIYNKVLHTLYVKPTINVYTDKKNYIRFPKENNFNIVDKCDQSDVVFLSYESSLVYCADKPIFVDNYNDFISIPNVIGAFYYRKGRPQLKLNKDYINQFDLNIDKSLLKYVE